MASMIFVNLPVKDLKASMDFYAALGFTNNPQFTDETAACMVVSDTIFVMLLTHPKYAEFTTKPIADATQTSAVLIALNRDSRAEVDATFEQAIKAGGKEARPTQELGFMMSRAFDDLDGHTWEVFWMDPSAAQ